MPYSQSPEITSDTFPSVFKGPDGGFWPEYDHDLTTSFEDIVLIPLPCWLFMLAMVLFFVMNRNSRHATNHVSNTGKQAETGESTTPPASTPNGARRQLRLVWTTYVFFLFTFGVLLLTIDEIVRLGILGWGIGLLPFVPITTFIVTTLYLMRYRLSAGYREPRSIERGITLRILGFWIFMMIMEVVKLHTLAKLSNPYPRQDSSYRASMQILDVVIIVICMASVFLMTLVELLRPMTTVQVK